MKKTVKNVKLQRINEGEKQTEGLLSIISVDCTVIFSCFTLELPDLHNQFQISNIPEGVYTVVKRWSKKYGHHFHVLDVENRTLILIHNGNFFYQTKGCILVGDKLTDINKDGLVDVTNSVNTMKKLNDLLPSEFEFVIS